MVVYDPLPPCFLLHQAQIELLGKLNAVNSHDDLQATHIPHRIERTLHLTVLKPRPTRRSAFYRHC